MGSRFDWRGLVNTPPTTLFDNTMEVTVGNKRLALTHLGSAHTRGDVLVHSPADRSCTPAISSSSAVTPCSGRARSKTGSGPAITFLGLDVDVIVPGHGPIAEKSAVRELKGYFEYIAAEARRHFDDGVPYEEAARKISLDRFASWLDPERIVINVASLYRQFSGAKQPLDRMTLFAGMKRYRDACAHSHNMPG